MPSTRYAEIAPRVKDISARYELPYNSGPFAQQLGMVQRTILRLAFPGGKPRPKPGPYRGGEETESVRDRKSTRLNSSHANISYAVFCLKKKKKQRYKATEK